MKSGERRWSYLTAGLASLVVSEFACVCERGYCDRGGCCRCCSLVRVNRHLECGCPRAGLSRWLVFMSILRAGSIYAIIVEFVVGRVISRGGCDRAVT